jgi:omega-hydroxy-beta-dihydromenaquinone-9 sulfotransferase
LLLKSPPNTARIREILELYPNAKFIHIHRHPYSVYLSNEKLYATVLPQLALQWTTAEKVQDHILTAYESTYRKFLEDRALLRDEQLIEFSYDAFVANPIDQLRMTYEQLKLKGFEAALPLFEAELKSTEGYATNSFPAMEANRKQQIAERWSFAFEAFGYKK